MRPAAIVVGLLVLTAALTGCMGAGEDASEEGRDDGLEEANANASPEGNATANASETVEDAGPERTVAWFNGSVQGQSAPAFGPFCAVTCDNRFDFNVTENATGLVAELAWETSSSMMFDVDIPYDTCDAGVMEDCPPDSTTGDGGHLAIRVTDEADVSAGEWEASAWTEDSPAEPVAFTIAVTQFHGEEIPRDHAKLAGAGS